MPFLEGPRKCMGDAFAMIEMRLVAATLLSRWRFEFVGEGLPRERPGFVMEAEGGIKMRLHSRQ